MFENTSIYTLHFKVEDVLRFILLTLMAEQTAF